MKHVVALCLAAWSSLWFTPDQYAMRQFENGAYAEAAEAFLDPLWQGVAWYRAGEFDKAAAAFARRDSAEAYYNQGNARVMLGKYQDAVECFDQALARRPGWQEAIDNRDLAAARAQRVAQTGGDMGDQKIGADKVVFDKQQKNTGQETQLPDGGELSDEAIQALWLRRVQTKPADFLKAKFAYQQALREGAQ